MQLIWATLTKQGQVTVPASLRRRLGLRAGGKVEFVVEDNGEVKLRAPRYPDVASLSGAAGSLPKPLSWKEVVEIAREDYVAEKYLKSDQ